MKKKKLRLKKKVKRFLIIFLIIVSLFIVVLNLPKHKETKKKVNKVVKKITKKKKTIKDKLQDQCQNINYCDQDKIDRYLNYYKDNNNLSYEDIFTRVNLNLDYEYYTHTSKADRLNKTDILVNKYLYLDEDYIPDNLETIPEEYARSGMKLVNVAKDAYVEMSRAARKEDLKIIAMSSYRSYKYQVNLYNKYKDSDGEEAADTYSARPGFSEHQTGLCIDVYDGKLNYTNFEKSKSFNWMQENAYKYGFILRFPKGKEDITGYQYESWHYRYVGKEIAEYIHENDITFDEYYVRKIANRD